MRPVVIIDENSSEESSEESSEKTSEEITYKKPCDLSSNCDVVSKLISILQQLWNTVVSCFC